MQVDAGGAPEHASGGVVMAEGPREEGELSGDENGPVLLTDEELVAYDPYVEADAM